MQSNRNSDRLISETQPLDQPVIGTKARAQRLVAEYLRMWGLRDPQAIADRSRIWVDQCDDSPSGGPDEPSLAEVYRTVMQRATNDMDRWLDHLALAAGIDAEDSASRRGLLAMEVQSLIDENPAALLEQEAPPARLLAQLQDAAHPVVPKKSPAHMPTQSLGELPDVARLDWWRRAISGTAAAAGRLISLAKLPSEQLADGPNSVSYRPRAILAMLTIFTTGCGAWIFGETLSARGIGPWSLILLPLFTVLFLWVSMSFWIATAGFVRRLRLKPAPVEPSRRIARFSPLTARTAIVMPIYNESPRRVFAGIRAIYESVLATGEGAAFDFFILSDTTDPDVWLAEELAWSRLNRAVAGNIRVYYRHRTKNIARKSGNIADFCERWGAAYRYMIVLDADSVMSGETIHEMVCRMEQDATIGILQAPPVPVNRESLFARCQQFAAKVYGPIFLEGFHWWAGDDGNYWGHNAIIRLDAFIKCCGLPKLPGSGPLGGEILSHDFVEAALMRRAGFKVCLAHDLEGSYEECPPTLIDFAQRDQRWCQGNLQHIRLIFTAGFRPVSRMHLGMGAMSYLSSPLWMLSLIVGFLAVVLRGMGANSAGQLQTTGGIHSWGAELFAATMALLLLPKLWSYILLVRDRRRAADFGGAAKIAAGVLLETLVSILVAPIMMAFHSAFVVSTFLGRRVQWNAQERDEQGLRLATAFSGHWKQTAAGLIVALAALAFAPGLMIWLAPIYVGLILAIPLSMLLSSTKVGQWLASRRLLLIPEEAITTTVLERRKHLLALTPAKDSVDPRSIFRRVLADPALLALHCSILDATGTGATISLRPVLLIQRQLLSGGTARVSVDNRKAILSDAAALRTLHLFAWSSPSAG